MWESSILPSWSLMSIDPEKGNLEKSVVSKCFDFLPNITENHIKNPSRWEHILTFSQKWTSDGSFLNATWMNVCSERWNDLIKAIYPASGKDELPVGHDHPSQHTQPGWAQFITHIEHPKSGSWLTLTRNSSMTGQLRFLTSNMAMFLLMMQKLPEWWA